MNEKVGFMNGITMYVMWGLFPLFWTLLSDVNSFDTLANRIVWSCVFSVGAIILLKKWSAFYNVLCELLRTPKKALVLFAASLCISFNWFMYIWAVANEHIIDTSLGYYINPLLSILFGVLIYKEKLLRGQQIALCIAGFGVLLMIVNIGEVPYIALSLALSFALYGVLKKQIQLEALHSVAIETLFVLPIAGAYLLLLQQRGVSAFGHMSVTTDFLLIISGVLTVIPLVCFAVATKHLPLYIIGFLQYITPTMTLLFGIFLYEETFTDAQFTSFAFIWVALLLFSVTTYRHQKKLRAVSE
ncbi:MAG: EamA family transporter RarD [Caryophanon sp.]|nr:EamA family transporter RarD [Caryophanon sp.]